MSCFLMINISFQSITHKRMKKDKHENREESGKNMPHGTDEENHYRQNRQRGRNTA